ncbi:MAG: DUF1624 domain-containing protein [Butyrivibrio sp.]|uniref:heparan-alpha-glucosaminide N-acetyltransferase domain-containing protein n=1 Tax=Butyrivibrio sp. TaxID=28121 RepID=UPI0025D51168|nr:heparan-alpha-glucosaminide N-acetyltransferase domain-containing protein [Butyrivibrio sp.]MCR5769962.1 DUF1624 domain-containing protein [Butyrivibrio sp.]
MPEKELHKKRIIWLDELRGLTIISMVFYHAMWDIVFLYGRQAMWYKGTFGFIWQQSICITFILISGFCFQMDKHPVKRGLLISFWGIVISVVTAIVEPSAIIIFGILTFYGASILIVTLLNKLFCKISSYTGFIISLFLFIITRDLSQGCLGFAGIRFLELPDYLYSNIITTFWGFMEPGFYSSDYFPIIPWIFLFLTGYFFYGIFQKSLLRNLDFKRGTFLSELGKHSLVIYILHQPLLSLLFMLIY